MIPSALTKALSTARWATFLILGLVAPLRSAEPPPIVILISIDGMRWDYLDRYAPPSLQALARDGVRAARLTPIVPTKTFPNHYTLVTGLRADRHGIVGNEMSDPAIPTFFRLADRAAVSDPRWWLGEPIWANAKRHGWVTASMFWPGSETAINGVQPAYWFPYEHMKPHGERVDQVLTWLDLPEEKRPAFITLYFAAVDDAGHRHGPLAPETRDALLEIDLHIGKLVNGVSARGLGDLVTWVVVSDHGMVEISRDRVVYLDDALPPESIRPEFLGPMAGLRGEPHEIDAWVIQLQKLEHVRVVRKKDLPLEAGYGRSVRVPDLLLMADEGWLVSTRAAAGRRAWERSKGDHGFDPAYGSMGGTLIVNGPGLAKGLVLPPVENVHVYTFLCARLGIPPEPNDGDDRLVRLTAP